MMNFSAWLQILVTVGLLVLAIKPLGRYMTRVYSGETTFLTRILQPVEQLLLRGAGVRQKEMRWDEYAVALLLFNGAGLLFLYALLRIQGQLALNPTQLPGVAPDLAFNTAASFTSNTNWQNYSGETTLSYLTQMVGLTVQNFLSAATGMAVLIALGRGLARQTAATIGNFWVDMTRTVLYILLPLAAVVALALVSQGVVQTWRPSQEVALVQPTAEQTTQTIALGPAASQIAIKQLGSNGGGFFGVNSAHPLENPTPLSNLIELVAILLLPAALCYTLGEMVGDTRQGWVLLGVMGVILASFLVLSLWAEQAGNPQLTLLGVDQQLSMAQAGGNMAGKEVRFGIVNSVLWGVATTATSNGSVNAMHDAFTPLGGLAPMLLMQLGEVIFGGVGSGLYGMLAFVLVAVFVAGLLVGRTPEYLHKKVEVFEMKMAVLVLLIPPALVLLGTAVAVLTPAGQLGATNAGPHGFSQILYAFSSQGNNNGSAFAGINGNQPFYNILGGVIMLIARYWLIVPTLALAGSLARKKRIPLSAGTLPTHTPLFAGWLILVVLLVGALSFLPALALGPIVEHLLLSS